MANPTTFIDQAFEELVRILMADATLAARVKTWRRWSSDPKDDRSSEVLPELCPIVWLSPGVGGGDARRVGGDGLLQTYAFPLAVEVETWITARPGGGLHRADALDLTALIYGALFPGGTAARQAIDARFRAVGVVDVVPRRPILPAVYNDQFIGSAGSIELDQRVDL